MPLLALVSGKNVSILKAKIDTAASNHDVKGTRSSTRDIAVGQPIKIELPIEVHDLGNAGTALVDTVATTNLVKPSTTDDGSIVSFLSFPNGTGESIATRQLHDELVALHVPPLPKFVAQKHQKKAQNHQETAKNSAKVAAIPCTFQDTRTKVTQVTKNVVAQLEHTTAPCKEESDMVKDSQTYIPPIEPNCEQQSATEQIVEQVARSPVAVSPSTDVKSVHSLETVVDTAVSQQLHDVDGRIYIARNTFMGITSLENSLDKLEFDTMHGTTTKTNICAAFAALAIDESVNLIGHRPGKDFTTVSSTFMQHRIKLGTTTLFAFLQGIHFDGDGIATIASVMRVFKKVAHQDQERSTKLGAALHFESFQVETASGSSFSRL